MKVRADNSKCIAKSLRNLAISRMKYIPGKENMLLKRITIA